MNRFRLLLATLALAALGAAAGCHSSANNSPAQTSQTAQQAQAVRKEQASDRELLDVIPPPAKSRYMAIHTRSGWQNPFLIVSKTTVTLRVMNPPPPQSSLLPSKLLQPTAARRRELELRLKDLPEALASVPQESWPYGRVVALEEDPNEVRSDRVQIRRNVETTIEMLNNLGVVVYEWPYAR
ncbi:MAG TPA: hypothetical protein VMD58_04015 [Acidobacteriaceae bacterium]|nr:hypothetical protein [Acidobacteriaceae bacterium]